MEEQRNRTIMKRKAYIYNVKICKNFISLINFEKIYVKFVQNNIKNVKEKSVKYIFYPKYHTIFFRNKGLFKN